MSPVTVGQVLLDTTYRKVLLDILRSVLLVLNLVVILLLGAQAS